jgi:hypothetical protein
MKAALLCACLVFLLACAGLCQDQPPVQTDLRGNIFEKDGTSPVEGAVVCLKRLPDGSFKESAPTDSEGSFEIDGIIKGVYILGVRTAEGNFSARKVLGIGALADGYAKMYIALFPFSGTEGSGDLPEVLPDPVGQAVVLAGNAALVLGIAEMNDRPKEAGPFKIKKPE